MKNNIFLSIISVIALATLFVSFDMPEGWFKAGNKSSSYQMGLEKNAGVNGGNAAFIKSIEKSINGFGTLMQNSSAQKYLGQRIRMSGFVKTKDVKNWAGLWLRVDHAESKVPLAFDNMHDRPIKGNTDWKKYEIVLDVPATAANLAYGVLLDGAGQVWFDNINFEIVDSTISPTGIKKENKEPVNLNLEK